MLTPIKPVRISDEIVGQIQDLIKNRKLQPGDNLPSERNMTKMLGVSRPPIREALSKLEAQGFIEMQHGRRFAVKSLGAAIFPESLAKAFADDISMAMQLLEIRKVLESWAASQASRFATDQEISELEDIYKEMPEDFDKEDLGVNSDAKFHMVIYKATHNVICAHLMSSLFDLLWRSQKLAREMMIGETENKQTLFKQHYAILKSIKERDPRKARAAVLKHLKFIEEQLVHVTSQKMKEESERMP